MNVFLFVLAGRGSLIPLLMAVVLVGVAGCTGDRHEEHVKSVPDSKAERVANELRNAVPITAAGLEVSLWASEELVSDPVGINFDQFGRAWIATTSRRRLTVPDAGAVNYWVADNLSWTSVDDRRDFLHRVLTPRRSGEHNWLSDFNGDGLQDWRDMTVQKDSVYLLEDLTGNGLANQARIMDWDVYTAGTEITGSVLYHEGELFVARAPDLLRISDRNGDGQWETARSNSYGYGVHLGYSGHGMSGLKIGPAGRIYWAIGDIGVNVTDSQGKKWYYPDEGAIMRSDPDGSNFEVFASGLRNVHEFDFDKYGNLIGIDNNGPGKDFDRLVYVINGSDSGWRIYWQMGKYDDPKNNDYRVWTEEEYFNTSFPDQAAHVLPPVAPGYSGPAGFVYHPGTALSEEWEDHFFASSFVGSPTRSGIEAFTLKQKGASFERDSSRTILRGLLSTSLDIGPDGALYTTDWIQGWVPKGTGRVWKIDVPSARRHAGRDETQNLLAEDFRNFQSQELLPLLGHDDRRVRHKAQFVLAGRDDTETLFMAMEQTEHQLARIHGIWGLAQVGRRITERIKPLIEYLDDSDAEVRAQAAKMLGDVRYQPAGASLIPLLQDDNARVRFFAAEALGRIRYQPAHEPIVEMIRKYEDVYLRQAGTIALERIGKSEALVQLADDPSKAVRKAALVALRRLKHPGVVRFLKDDDEAIVTDAARAINDEEFIEAGLSELARMLTQHQFTGEPLLRRAVNASLYGGTPADAERLAAFAVRKDISDELRIEALNTLLTWPESSVFDRVTGKYRGSVRNDPAHARQAAVPVIAQILKGEKRAIKLAALQLAGGLKATIVVPEILNLISGDPSAEVRMASLDVLQQMNYEDMDEVVSIALEDNDSRVRMNALGVIPDLDLPVAPTVSMLEAVLEEGTHQESQMALETLGKMDDPVSYQALHRQMDLLMENALDREIQLDLIHAVEMVNSESLHDRLRQYQANKSPDDSVAVYRESLYGGNAERGKEIFLNHAHAQCITCHPGGGGAGPDLSSIGARLTRSEVLRSLVDPNARIAPGYGSVMVTLDDGDTLQGVLSDETGTQLVVTREGQEWKIDKSDISGHRYSPSSMPAMGSILTRSELRDLVAYLATLRDSAHHSPGSGE